MFGSAILDVAIGLTFIYLVLSLVVTALNEFLAALLHSRGKFLERGLRQLLDGGAADGASVSLIRRLRCALASAIEGAKRVGGDRSPSWFRTRLASAIKPTVARVNLTSRILGHPLLRALQYKGWPPSYIPPRLFVTALLDELKIATNTPAARADAAPAPADMNHPLRQRLATLADRRPDQDLENALVALYEEAGGRVEQFKVELERWFNYGMDRVTGWYKRRTQVVTVLIAAIVTVLFNADTVVIVRSLWLDEELREGMVTLASDPELRASLDPAAPSDGEEAPGEPAGAQTPAGDEPSDDQDAEKKVRERVETMRQVMAVGVPIGWLESTEEWNRAREAAEQHRRPPPFPASEDGSIFVRSGIWLGRWGEVILFHLAGWAVTILAVSLGAPFWFDTLNRIINIRAAGKAPEDRPKEPRQIPQPDTRVDDQEH